MTPQASRPGRAEAIGRLRDRLLADAHPEGGWPYRPGAAPRVEPTVWALLALGRASDARAASTIALARDYLTRRPRDAGLVVDGPGLPPNVGVNAQLAFLLQVQPEGHDDADSELLDTLTDLYGTRLEPSPYFEQDNSLRGWPWIDTTFSWVEPTSWGLLALKRVTPAERSGRQRARIAEADALLLDRACRSGGWNYGNSVVLGRALEAYVPTTAVALLALQDRRDHDVVRRSLAHLVDRRLEQASGMGLALTVLCLGAYGVPADDVAARLAEIALETETPMNLHAAAMSLSALEEDDRGHRLFRLQG